MHSPLQSIGHGRLICWLLAALIAAPAPAQTTQDEIQPTDFNYVYSAVLGTGFYKTSTERIFVLRVPMSWEVAHVDERNSLDLLTPVSFGVRDLRDDEGDFELPDRLLTLSFLPGLAWQYRAKNRWQITPSLQAGAARDFQADTTAWMYTGALRSYAWWDIGKHRLGLGNRVLGAGQHIDSSDSQQGFIMLENGLDWNYQLPWQLAERPLSSSVFVLWQHYIDDLDIPGVSGETVVLENLYYLGFTFGFREKLTLLGFIPFKRAGFSFVRGNTAGGDQLKAFTLNLGFPLSYM